MKKGPAPSRPQRRCRRVRLQTTSEPEYRVGPGHPPKEYQFKPGQSGNPAGAKRRARSIAPDLKDLVERALNAKVTLRQGDQEKIISKAAAGIEQLVNQFAKGDRHARRDLLIIAQTLGIDLVAGPEEIEGSVAAAISANDEALLADYVRRHSSYGHILPNKDSGKITTKTRREPLLENPHHRRVRKTA
jgi:hypothetical protein